MNEMREEKGGDEDDDDDGTFIKLDMNKRRNDNELAKLIQKI